MLASGRSCFDFSDPNCPDMLVQCGACYGSARRRVSSSTRAATSLCHQSRLFHSTVRYHGRMVQPSVGSAAPCLSTTRFLRYTGKLAVQFRDRPLVFLAIRPVLRRCARSVAFPVYPDPVPTVIFNKPVPLILIIATAPLVLRVILCSVQVIIPDNKLK